MQRVPNDNGNLSADAELRSNGIGRATQMWVLIKKVQRVDPGKYRVAGYGYDRRSSVPHDRHPKPFITFIRISYK